MDAQILIAVAAIAAPVGFIATIYVLFFRHATAKSLHPDAEKIVWADVCDAHRERVEDALKAHGQRISELKDDIQRQFRETKQLIRNGGKDG